jgi:hypothetical protein
MSERREFYSSHLIADPSTVLVQACQPVWLGRSYDGSDASSVAFAVGAWPGSSRVQTTLLFFSLPAWRTLVPVATAGQGFSTFTAWGRNCASHRIMSCQGLVPCQPSPRLGRRVSAERIAHKRLRHTQRGLAWLGLASGSKPDAHIRL